MGHEEHHHEEEKPLSLFASPLHKRGNTPNYSHVSPVPSSHGSDLEHQKTADTNHAPFDNMDCSLHDNPAFHRHAEATTAELFYDLFFVANLTTFTSMLEINDRNSLTAYIGFFSLLWLTWYQVSLYDVRFSTDSIFERVAKAIHFGVMVGFAVIGPQWKPGQEQGDYHIYKAFGLILMVSRITLFLQYGVTLFYTKQYKKTIIPLGAIMASTLVAAILYGALTPTFPATKYDPVKLDPMSLPAEILQKSDAYIAWYVIGITETLVTVGVSCIWRIISFKGTHMVQRMSLLTLIILGEGIIVICKSISKIIKNDYQWSSAIIGQIVASILIIYFLYMIYFDRIEEEHFGTIKQQWWSFLHFPLHTTLVLVLQGVSLLVIWLQAVNSYDNMALDIMDVVSFNYSTGVQFAHDFNYTVYNHVYGYIPYGVDVSKEVKANEETMLNLVDLYDIWYADDGSNQTYSIEVTNNINADIDEAFYLATKSLFSSLSVNTPKKKSSSVGKESKGLDPAVLAGDYVKVFELVFQYVFIAVSASNFPSYPRILY
jgi:low temperature requirement protein LtrA